VTTNQHYHVHRYNLFGGAINALCYLGLLMLSWIVVVLLFTYWEIMVGGLIAVLILVLAREWARKQPS
jgi:hypothetical protein